MARSINYVKWKNNPAVTKFIRDNAEELTDAEGAKQLSLLMGKVITVDAWRKARQRLGITKAAGRGISRVVSTQQE